MSDGDRFRQRMEGAAEKLLTSTMERTRFTAVTRDRLAVALGKIVEGEIKKRREDK